MRRVLFVNHAFDGPVMSRAMVGPRHDIIGAEMAGMVFTRCRIGNFGVNLEFESNGFAILTRLKAFLKWLNNSAI